MEIVKKNWVSILCGVIALIAVIAIPTFVSSQQKQLQNDLNKRKETYDTAAALLAKQRHQPVVSLDPNAPAVPLNGFPSPKVIEQGIAAMSKVQAQSQELKKLAASMNAHQLLVEGSLPSPKDSYMFQQAYLRQFQTEIPQALNSITPPTEEAIRAEHDRREKDMTDKWPHDPVTHEILNKPALDQNIQRMSITLPEEMRINAATQHKIYMDPSSSLSMHPGLQPGNGGMSRQLDAETVWYAQMGLWVQQDVVNTIAELNKDSHDVEHSPVKQLLQILVASDKNMYAIPSPPEGTPAVVASATPTVATNTDADPLPKDFTVSPTGRICNGVFDVVHFTVSMNVQAADINRVIQGLERGRLLTVFQTDIQAVNSAEMKQLGYYFGSNPVATITLNCEELFMRDWTRPYMPPPVKQLLNVQEPGAAAQQPTASTN